MYQLKAAPVAFLLLLLCWFSMMAAINPAKPIPQVEEKKAEPIPQLPAKTNWGQVEQKERRFIIAGHEQWSGRGEISEDGKTVRIFWTKSEDIRLAYGVYKLDADTMTGRWVWLPEVIWQVVGDEAVKDEFRETIQGIAPK
jgi:hypothetical protein